MNSVQRTTAIDTLSMTIVVARTASTPPRAKSTATTMRRRSSRSAMAPAYRLKSSHGRYWSRVARATSRGSRVCEATRRGPADTAIPSPRFDVPDEASNHRNETPNRLGAMTSTMRPTVDEASRSTLVADVLNLRMTTPADDATLAAGRKRIDEIDAQIIALVRERVSTSAELQRIRMAAGEPRIAHTRELQIVARYS